MRYPNDNTPIKWTKEFILQEIANKSKNGLCKSSDVGMALTGMAKRIFGSFKVAVELTGNKRWADRDRLDSCIFDGCGCQVRSPLAKYCEKHYGRIRRNGSLSRLDGKEVSNITEKCLYCKKQTNINKQYCSHACNLRSLRNSKIEKACKNCNTKFNAAMYGKGSNRVFCCEECKRQSKRSSEKLYRKANKAKYAERERNAEYKRKALKAAVAYEDIDRKIVFERDGNICMLCNESVDLRLKWPDRYSATLDHILPLSKGGSHTYDNVQTAHLTCNCSKNNKTYKQKQRIGLDGFPI